MSTERKSSTVAHFMTPTPCTVGHDLSLADARDRMEANNIRHLLVTRSGRLVGLLSSRDVTFAQSLTGTKAKKIPVAEAMSDHVYTCSTDAPLDDVAAEMEEHRYGCAVVLDGEFVVGIFTTTDALRAVRALIRGEDVSPKTVPTHLVDVTGEREKVEHHVRLSETISSARPHAGQGMGFGTVGV